MENNSFNRRFFFRGSLSAAALFGLGKLKAAENFSQEDNLRISFFINPAFSVDTTATGDMVLTAKTKEGMTKEVAFRNLEKDLLILVRQNSLISDHITGLAANYHIPDTEIAGKCRVIMNRFQNDGIIVNKDSKMNIIQNVIRDAKDQ